MDTSNLKICPECQEELEHKNYKIFHNWVCPNGHGTLYPKDELENILKTLTGIEDLNLGLWKDKKTMRVERSHLMSPDGPRPLLEIQDPEHPQISIFGDPVTHSLWIHTGEEEKIQEYLEKEASIESVATYIQIAGKTALELFDDSLPLNESAGHLLLSLKLLGERIMKAMPYIAF